MTPLPAVLAAALLLATPAVAQTSSHDHTSPPQAPAERAQPGTTGPGMMQGGPGMMGPGMMSQGGGHMMGGPMMGGQMMGGQMMGQGGGMGPGMMQGGMMQGGMNQQGMTTGPSVANAPAAPRIEGRLAFIKAELKITEAQLPAWNAFADAVRTNLMTSHAERHAMRGEVGADVTLPDRLLAQANAFAAHAEEMTRLKQAIDPLYAALTPEQKKVADEIVFSPMGLPVGMM